MFILALVVFIACPILSIPFIVVGLKNNSKHRNLFLFLIASLFALFSYCYNPTASDDLYRHHEEVRQYENTDLGTLLEKMADSPEQISIAYKFIIGKTGNENLLQYFVALLCYFILLYLLDVNSKENEDVSILKKIGVWFFVLSGFHYLVITSGMFYTLALEIFSLGIFFDYKFKKKKLGTLLCILPVFIHTCAVLPLVVLVIFKMLGSKMTTKSIIGISVFVFSIGFLMTVVAPNINNPITNELAKLYSSYFNNEEHWSRLHKTTTLILYLSRLVPVVFGFIITKKRDPISDFSVAITVLVLVLFVQTSFSIRYIHIATLCGIPLFFHCTKDKKYGQMYTGVLYLLAIPQIYYQLRQISYSGSIENIEIVLIRNIIGTLSGK